MPEIEVRPPDTASTWWENYIQNRLANALQQTKDPDYVKRLEEWYRGEVFSGGLPTDEESAAARGAPPGYVSPPGAFEYSLSQQVRTPGITIPTGPEGLDINGRPIYGGYVQDENSGMNAVPPGQGSAPGTNFGLSDIGVNIPTTGPRYQYGTGMDFGMPDIVPGGWTNSEEQQLRNTDPFNKELQLGGKYYREINQGGRDTFGFDASTGMLNNPGWTNPEELYLRNYDPKNPVFNPGGRYYREPPAWSLGDSGFPTPPTSGPRYQYGMGMDFGRPDIVPGGWTNPEEQNLRINDPGNTALQLGGKYYRQIDPGGIAQFGLNTSTGMLNDPGWTNPEEMYLRNYDADNSAFNSGGAYYREPSGYVPASTLNGFSTSGVSNPGYQTTMPAAAEQVGGFSPGDMGDAITNQQSEYMNAARAAAAQEAAYQQRVQSERAAVDASIAANAAQSNAGNPQYNLQNNFNQNVAGLNNPVPGISNYSQFSTQYQQY